MLAGSTGSIRVQIEGAELTTLGAHATKVRGLVIGHRGARIASGSEDGVIQVWDRATGRHLTLRGHRQRIRHLAFSADDASLYSADGEGVVRTWELDHIPTTLFDDHHDAAIEYVATDGHTLASSDETNTVVATELATGGTRIVGRAADHITALAVAGTAAISGEADGTITWWRTSPVRASAGSSVRGIAVDRDGRVAVATIAGPVAIVFGADGTRIATLPRPCRRHRSDRVRERS